MGDAGVGKTTLVKTATALRCTPDGERSTLWLRPPTAIPATPGTVLAPLVSDDGIDGTAAHQISRLIVRARRALADLGANPLLIVDDAHLIDNVTALILAELVDAGATQVVAICRRLPVAPDPLRRLVRQGTLHQVDVSGLDHDQVEAVLQASLGGPVARETVSQARDMTGGNPLYLRELVRSLRDVDALLEVNGAWVWHDRTVLGRRLTDMIRAELDTLGSAERDVVELLALAGPTALDQLAGAVEDGALTTASDRGLVVLESHHHDGVARARLAHPVHAEVIRTVLPPGRRRSLYKRLPLTRADSTQPVALSSMVDWALSCGVTPAVGDLIAATRAAAALPDHRLTRRLTNAVLTLLKANDTRALDLLLTRAEVARLAGEGAAAAQDLQAVAQHLPEGPESESLRWHHTRITADLQQYGEEGPEAALTTITRAPLTDQSLRSAREADRLVRLLRAGDFRRGLPEFERFVEHHRGSHQRLPVLGTLVLGLAQSGRLEEALAVADDALHSWRVDPGRSPWLLTELLGSRFMAALWIGDPERAMHPPHVHDPLAQVDDAVVQVGSGRYYAAQGDWTTAVAHFRGALSRFAIRDPFGFGPTASANLAYSLAAIGDHNGSQTARRDYENTRPGGSRAVHGDSEMRLLVASVALGEADAAERCERLEEWSTAEGLWLPAMHARHLRCVIAAHRRGLQQGEIVHLAEAAGYVDGPIPPMLVDHARALANEDFVLAGRLSGRLLEYGIWIPEQPVVDLTPRQREIAMLVRAGLSNREIAERFVLSVRTVDTHVSHIFDRVGVNTRADLASVLSSKILSA